MKNIKDMTIDEIWRECLAMWKWIATKRKEGNRQSVENLKYAWLEQHGYELNLPDNDCFFCEFTEWWKWHGYRCDICPGALVDPSFRCQASTCHYSIHPIQFYHKLVELNAKRKRP